MRSPQAILNEYFGYASFRPYQEEIIAEISSHNDVLAVLATGTGKSLCYQIPALMGEGVAIVISPLIALMKDQVDALSAKGIPAATINSSQSSIDQNKIKSDLKSNKITILYLSPERVLQNDFLGFLKTLSISFIAIDEAHCISMWGHSFRPEYRQLRQLKKFFPDIPIIALTATATQDVRDDILKQLKMQNPKVFVGSFNRENLNYIILPKKQVYSTLRTYLLGEMNGSSGIVYCLSRKSTEKFAQNLRKDGFAALPYHAGLSSEVRKNTQDRFISGETPIICATIAFGMGIDKPDVRFVIHTDLPNSIEAYYQETGRAGRDGKKSDCILFYGKWDVFNVLKMIEGDLKENPVQLKVARKKIDDLVHYCESSECRRWEILNYFGELSPQKTCLACDKCVDLSDVYSVESRDNHLKKTYAQTVLVNKSDVTEFTTQPFLPVDISNCIHKLHQSYSPSYIAKILTASRSSVILQNRHDQLSCYGIGRQYARKELTEIIRNIIKRGGSEPVTPENKKNVQLKFDQDLYTLLINLRQELMDNLQLPAEAIFPDRSLEEMAIYYPQSESVLINIFGVSSRKLHDYGAAFLELIRSYCLEKKISNSVSSPITRQRTPIRSLPENDEWIFEEIAPLKKRGIITPTLYKTHQLICQGHTIPRVAEIRELKISTICGHCVDLLLLGEKIPQDLYSSLIPLSKHKAIIEMLNEFGCANIGEVKHSLGDDYSYDEIHASIAYSIWKYLGSKADDHYCSQADTLSSASIRSIQELVDDQQGDNIMIENSGQKPKTVKDQNEAIIVEQNNQVPSSPGGIQDRLHILCSRLGISYKAKETNEFEVKKDQRINGASTSQKSTENEPDDAKTSRIWQRCFGGSKDDRAYSIQQTLDGGYIVAGWTESNDGDVSGNHGGRDAWVMKLDSVGRIVWERCLGGFSVDEAHYIQQTPDGGYIVAGKTRSNDRDVAGNHGLFDAWVVKLSSDGAIEWQRCIGGSKVDIACCVQNTQDGGFVIAGETASSDGDIAENRGGFDGLVAKLNANGEIEWHRILGGSKDDHVFFISPTSDGGYIAAGRTNSNDGDVSGNHGSFDAWVVKLNAQGVIEWQRCLGGSAEEIAYCIRQTADGGYIFAGRTNSNDGDVSGNHGHFDAWVVKLNAQGDIEWQRCLGGSGVDEAYSIQQTSDGGYIVAGRTSSNDGDVSGNHGDNDAWIVKLDFQGDIEWQRCLGGSSYDSARCIQQTSDGGFIVCGFTRSDDGDIQSSHGGADAWVVKLDADGKPEWDRSSDEEQYALIDRQPFFQNEIHLIDYPLQDIISEKIDEAVVYIEGSNIEGAMRMLQGVLELDQANFMAKSFIKEINIGNIGIKSRCREMLNIKPPIPDPVIFPPSLSLSEFHRPYDLILRNLYPDFEVDQDGFKKYLLTLQKPSLSLINKYRYGDPVDYNNPDLQAAYLLRYFPYYIETLQRILEKNELNNNLLCQHNPLICCFYGAGPAPEVLGLARYLKTINEPPASLDAYFYDSGDWTYWRRFAIDVLLPNYNDQIVLSNQENFNMDFFDIVNAAQTNALDCIRHGHLHIMQNCCTDFLRREKNMQNVVLAICNLFQMMAPGSLFVLSDVRSREVPLLFQEIADTITGIEKTGRLIDDFDFSEQSYTPRFVVNPVVKEVLFDHESLRSRSMTRHTTLVLQRT